MKSFYLSKSLTLAILEIFLLLWIFWNISLLWKVDSTSDLCKRSIQNSNLVLTFLHLLFFEIFCCFYQNCFVNQVFEKAKSRSQFFFEILQSVHSLKYFIQSGCLIWQSYQCKIPWMNFSFDLLKSFLCDLFHCFWKIWFDHVILVKELIQIRFFNPL
jgi:hypothetical protein